MWVWGSAKGHCGSHRHMGFLYTKIYGYDGILRVTVVHIDIWFLYIQIYGINVIHLGIMHIARVPNIRDNDGQFNFSVKQTEKSKTRANTPKVKTTKPLCRGKSALLPHTLTPGVLFTQRSSTQHCYI